MNRLKRFAVAFVVATCWLASTFSALAEAPKSPAIEKDVAHDHTHASQKLDVYLAETATPLPAMIHIHGGGWRGGSKNGVPGWLLNLGYAPGTPANDMDAQAKVDVSPISFVSPDDPPIMQVHGDQDDIVPIEHARAMHERLKSAGVKTELVVIAGANHGVAGAGPQVTERPLAFVREQLKLQPPAPAGREQALFEEHFDGRLQDGWQWVREDPAEWRIRDNQLEVRSQSGRIWGGNDAKNIVLRSPLKQQNLAASVTVAHKPGEKWEQAGLLWYVDDDNFVKLISEHIDGKMYVVTARELGGKGTVVGKLEVPAANLHLRLRVQAGRVIGQWRLKPGDSWSDAGTCEFDAQGEPRFGLFTQNGPANETRWVRFDDFAVCALAESR